MTLSFVIIVMCHEKSRLDKWLRIEEKWLRMVEKSDWIDEKWPQMMAIEGAVVMPEMGVNGSNCYYTRPQIFPHQVAIVPQAGAKNVTNMTNDTVIFRERVSRNSPFIISYLYIIYILYINMLKITTIPENLLSKFCCCHLS